MFAALCTQDSLYNIQRHAKHSQHRARQVAASCLFLKKLKIGYNKIVTVLKFAGIHQKLLQSESINGSEAVAFSVYANKEMEKIPKQTSQTKTHNIYYHSATAENISLKECPPVNPVLSQTWFQKWYKSLVFVLPLLQLNPMSKFTMRLCIAHFSFYLCLNLSLKFHSW